MVKRFFIFFLIVTAGFFFLLLPVDAQEEGERPLGYVTRCLKPKKYFPPSCPFSEGDPNRSLCVNSQPAGGYPGSSQDHTIEISSSGFSNDKSVFIVGCVSVEGDYKCTAGSVSANEKIEQEVGFPVDKDLNPSLYTFEIKNNPVKTVGRTVSVVVRSVSSVPGGHAFFAVYPVEESSSEGSESSVQYGTFPFTENPENCVSIYWDPEGYVFDAESLMPIANATVEIRDKEGKLIDTDIALNPIVKTDIDGSFQFYAPAGFYKLYPFHPDYSFPVKSSEINEDFSEYYKCEFDDLDLYNDYYIVEEKAGKITRCDIPMKSKTNNSDQENEIVLKKESEYISSDGKTLIYIVRVNRPDLKVKAYYINKKGKKKYIGKAKKYRPTVWRIAISTSKLNEINLVDMNIYFEAKEKDKKLSFLKKLLERLAPTKVFAAGNTIKTPLILRYLEGYAYNDRSEIVPYATVYIVSQSSGKKLFGIKADENGFFKVPPAYLPPFPYKIMVESKEGDTYRYTTAEFIRLNKVYIERNKLDLVQAKKAGQPIRFSPQEIESVKKNIVALEKQNKPNIAPTVSVAEKKEEKTLQQDKQNVIILVSVLLAALIIIALVILFFLLKIKREKSFVDS